MPGGVVALGRGRTYHDDRALILIVCSRLWWGKQEMEVPATTIY